MSSVYWAVSEGQFDAHNANDGYYLPTQHDIDNLLKMAVTAVNDNPYWRVDLLDTHCIWAVRMLNRANLSKNITVYSIRKSLSYI